MIIPRLAVVFGISVALAACGGRTDDLSGRTATSSAEAPAASAAPAQVRAKAEVDLPRPPISADAGIAELRQEVMLLRREVVDLRQQVARLPGQDTMNAKAPNPRTDPVARQEAQQAEAQRLASSETAFRNERSDPRWGQTTTAALQATMGEVDPSLRNQVRSIECRSKSCRVEINAGGDSALAQQLPVIVARLGDTLPNVTAGQIDQGDGRQSTVLYLSR